MNPISASVQTFLTQAIVHQKLANGYVLTGKNATSAAHLALWLAQSLNCSQFKTENTPCGQCQNCQWIAQNAHPAVVTISPLSGFLGDKASKTGQHIVTEQIELMCHSLVRSSPYYRVVCFTGAQLEPSPQAETPPYPSTCYPPPKDWVLQQKDASDSGAFTYKPLTRTMLTEKAANQFLKLLEEPPPNLLFVFITDSVNTLLPTIVSRCQVLALPSETLSPQDLFELSPAVTAVLHGWLSGPQATHWLQQYHALMQAFADTAVQTTDVSRWMAACRQYWLTHASSDGVYRQVLEALEQALLQLKAKTHEKAVLQTLCQKLAQN